MGRNSKILTGFVNLRKAELVATHFFVAEFSFVHTETTHGRTREQW